MITREYLDGTHFIYQDDALYRFTSDAVLLSRFAGAKKGDIAADFCAGAGIVGMNLFLLHPEIAHVTLVELQPELAALAARSVKENGFSDRFTVENRRVQDFSRGEFAGRFSLITANPPYCERQRGFVSERDSDALARWEIALTLPELVESAANALRFGGRFALAHRADRLTDVLTEMRKNRVEPKRLMLLTGGRKKESYLVLIEGVKGGKPGLSVTNERN